MYYPEKAIEVDGSKPNEATVCDMQEIKHGSWEYDSEGVGYANYLCSECGNFLTFYEDIDLYPYCPYCGAKMKQERDTD
jgi:DNA-directed RNA polymerase subunit RPC12/RpoP